MICNALGAWRRTLFPPRTEVMHAVYLCSGRQSSEGEMVILVLSPWCLYYFAQQGQNISAESNRQPCREIEKKTVKWYGTWSLRHRTIISRVELLRGRTHAENSYMIIHLNESWSIDNFTNSDACNKMFSVSCKPWHDTPEPPPDYHGIWRTQSSEARMSECVRRFCWQPSFRYCYCQSCDLCF